MSRLRHAQKPPRSEARLLAEQDELVRLRRDLLRAQQELEQTRAEREHSLAQIRDVNERLVIASMRADELAEHAEAGRQRAEALARQLTASEAAARVSKDQFRTIANTVEVGVRPRPRRPSASPCALARRARQRRAMGRHLSRSTP
jgi:hypothetical protein